MCVRVTDVDKSFSSVSLSVQLQYAQKNANKMCQLLQPVRSSEAHGLNQIKKAWKKVKLNLNCFLFFI